MKIHTLWGTRKALPNTPELMVAWDENSTADNPHGFHKECEEAKKSWGDELCEFRTIVILLPDGRVEEAFATTLINLYNG